MKTFIAYLLLVSLSFAQSPFETSYTLQQAEGITAKAAIVEPMSDRVAVFLSEPDATKQIALIVRVTSTAKFVSVRARELLGPRVAVSRMQNGAWFFFGRPTKYEIEISEYDPEKGINFTDVVAEIKGSVSPGPTPDPPANGFENVRLVAQTKAKALNDPKTAKTLSEAYTKAVSQMTGKTLMECQTIAMSARRAALLTRTGSSLLVDWNSFLLAVDQEIKKVVTTAEQYQAAIIVVAEAIL